MGKISTNTKKRVNIWILSLKIYLKPILKRPDLWSGRKLEKKNRWKTMRESWEKNKKETFGKKTENKIRMKVYRKKKKQYCWKGPVLNMWNV